MGLLNIGIGGGGVLMLHDPTTYELVRGSPNAGALELSKKVVGYDHYEVRTIRGHC